MSHEEDIYRILGIHSSATPEQIKEAYLYKANILHPDRLAAMPDKIRGKAEEDLKKVNVAYEILSNPAKRQHYDETQGGTIIVQSTPSSSSPPYASPSATSSNPPKPEVHPKTVTLHGALAYVPQKGSFFVRNAGGSYEKLLLSTPPSWLKIVKVVPLQGDAKLPMQVVIEAVGIQWNKVYSSEIIVRLDDKEARVKIKLCMQRKSRRFWFW